MGMFDKDKEYGNSVHEMFALNTPFILWGARITRTDVQTTFGAADQATLTVSAMDAPDERYDVTTLKGAITAKVKEAEADDFPAIVKLLVVPTDGSKSDATVLRFLKPYDARNNRQTPPVPASAPEPSFDTTAAGLPADSTV